VQDVNKLLKMHQEMAGMMKKMKKMGGLKGLGAMFGGGGGGMGGAWRAARRRPCRRCGAARPAAWVVCPEAFPACPAVARRACPPASRIS
jgi:phage-related minor tail protein